ncbi:MAG: hypothetical protein R2848_06760 [Thermomicrobiales bacterium]
MVMKYVNWALRRQAQESDTPRCPDHKIEMRLRGIIGQPARFRWQTEEDYTYIYFCPVDKCNQTVEVIAQSAGANGTDIPARPVYARPNDR